MTPNTHVESAIQAGVNQVQNSGGGTVYLPQGDFLYDPPLSYLDAPPVQIPVGVNLVGPGSNLCLLRNLRRPNYYDGSDGLPTFMSLSGTSLAPPLLKGFSLIGFRAQTQYKGDTARVNGIGITDGQDFVLSDVGVIDVGGAGVSIAAYAASTFAHPLRGVLSHCRFVNTSGVPASSGGGAYGQNVLGYGVEVHGSGRTADWISDVSQIYGKYDYGKSVVYVEDSYFSRWRHCIASASGAHYVFRYNILETNCGFNDIDEHGNGWNDVGTRLVEVYNNNCRLPTLTDTWNTEGVSYWFQLRGGDGLIFNNILSDYTEVVQFAPDPAQGSIYYPNNWWFWNNDWGGSSFSASGIPHYYTSKPASYTPYTYPHPLVGGASGTRLRIESSRNVPFTLRKK